MRSMAAGLRAACRHGAASRASACARPQTSGLRQLWAGRTTLPGGLAVEAGARRASLPWAAAGSRLFASEGGRQEGIVKMWNEERGFGFISPHSGGEDVFVHRSAVGDGVQLMSGIAVTFEAQWDERKRKERAAEVQIAEGGGGAAPAASGDAEASPAPPAPGPPGSPGSPGPPRSPPPATARPKQHSIVGDFGDWAIHREPMAPDETGSVRHRLTVRGKAKGDGDIKQEEFQIVGDGSWDHRLYPSGGDHEEVVVLKAGGPGSKAEFRRGKGHGRNWAVEGKVGAVFDIFYDPETSMVFCKEAFAEA